MNLAIRGPCCTTGYGNVYRSLAKRMARRFGSGLQALALNNHVSGDFPVPICQRQTHRTFGLLVGYPGDIHQLGTTFRILYSMTEVSDLPDDWKPELNHAHEVWTPSTFSAEVFAQYHPRVKVVPVGYEEESFNREGRDAGSREAFWSEVCPDAVGKRVLGTAGCISDRKGIDVLLRAWDLACLEDSVLVVKSRETPIPFQLPRGVYLIEDNWAEQKLADFYRSLDLFVLPTRGEGLGLQPLESVACGTPALVTRATGPVEYIDDRGVYGLDVAGQSPVRNMRASHAFWVEPSLSALVDSLRSFCDNPLQVEHHYRQWSMGGLEERWARELEAAERRCLTWMYRR